MTRMALRGLLARKLRTALTGFAVVIGVAFVAGSFIFTDTINASFDELFKQRLEGRRRQRHRQAARRGRLRRPHPAAARRDVREGRVGARRRRRRAAVPDRGHDLRQGRGADRRQRPALDRLQPEREALRPVHLRGRRPGRRGRPGHDRQGDRRPPRLPRRRPAADRGARAGQGLRDRPGSRSSATRTRSASSAWRCRWRRSSGSPRGRASSTRSRSRRTTATSPEELKADISACSAGPRSSARARSRRSKSAADISDSLGFLTVALLVFAGVAVLVGGFLIFNTFAVTVAQRSREFALLRTLGASRRQMLKSVVVETLDDRLLRLGDRASSAGSLIAPGLRGAARVRRDRAALDRHRGRAANGHRRARRRHDRHAGLGAGAGPARDAGRAGRGDARGVDARRPARRRQADARLGRRDRRSGWSRSSSGCSAADGSTAAALLGLGVVAMMLGVALLAPVLVAPLARIIGAPLQRIQGMPGRLARENAERQPQRTAITASALMIGLALVVFTAIFAAGLRGSIDKVVDEQFSRTALFVTHDDGFSPVAPEVASSCASVAGVQVVYPTRFDQANVKGGGGSLPGSGIDPSTMTQLFDPELAQGAPDTFAKLRDNQVLADNGWAKDHGFKVGDTMKVTTPKGAVLDYKLAGTYDAKLGVLGDLTVTNDSMSKEWNQPDDNFILVGGTGDAEKLEAAAKQALKRLPDGQGADARPVQGRVGRPGQPAPRARVRAAGAVGDRRAARHRQHARARGPRTDARAGAAARRRDEQAPGPPHGPRRVGDHGADRRRPRARARASSSRSIVSRPLAEDGLRAHVPDPDARRSSRSSPRSPACSRRSRPRAGRRRSTCCAR